MSIEVGLGGDASLTPQIEMVEAGIKLAWDSTTGKQMTVPWWEVTGNRKDMPPQNAALSMKAGDRIQVYVSSNMNNNGKDVFTIQNLTTKKTFTHTLADPTALSDGASAPCLIMRPTTTDANSHKQVVAALANFGKMTVQNCSIYTSAQQRNNWAPIGNMVHDNINMHSEFANHSIIATTSALRHGVDFDVTWLGTGSAPTPTPTP
jgi:hypothetical protein